MVKVDGRHDDVIVDVLLVGMGGNNESMVAFREEPRQLLPHAVGFLRCDFAGDKRLPQMIRDRTCHMTPREYQNRNFRKGIQAASREV